MFGKFLNMWRNKTHHNHTKGGGELNGVEVSSGLGIVSKQ